MDVSCTRHFAPWGFAHRRFAPWTSKTSMGRNVHGSVAVNV